jgi:hypothetical protein
MTAMPSNQIENERKACDAVVRSLEGRAGATRSNAHSPEDDKVGPPVEYVFELDGQTYALEHTVVEAFEDRFRRASISGRSSIPSSTRWIAVCPLPAPITSRFKFTQPKA